MHRRAARVVHLAALVLVPSLSFAFAPADSQDAPTSASNDAAPLRRPTSSR